MEHNATTFWRGERRPGSHNYLKDSVLKACKQYGGRRILDIGCGNGWMCRDLLENGFDIVGVEPNTDGIKNARKLLPRAKFYQLGVYDPPEEMSEDAFDIAISTEVIEHLFEPAALLRFSSRTLADGGILVLTTPYHGYLKNVLISLLGKWDSHHSPWHDGGHIKFWSRRSLSELLQKNGYDIVEFSGVGRVPFLWKSMVFVCRKQPAAAAFAD